MDTRTPLYSAAAKPSTIPPFVETHLPPGTAPPNSGPRPLSDIRELSEPSFIDAFVQLPGNNHKRQTSVNRENSLRQTSSLKRVSKKAAQPSRPIVPAHARHEPPSRPHSACATSSSYSSTPERSSFFNIPLSSVPRRSSSRSHSRRPPTAAGARQHARKPSFKPVTPPPISQQPRRHPAEGFIVPNYGGGDSPVKVAKSKHDAVRSDGPRGHRVPSRTYIRSTPQTDILEFPTYRHPRVKLDLQPTASLFIGGGSIEGNVKLTIDSNSHLHSRRSLSLTTLSIDLIGFEDVDSGGRKATFLCLGADVIDNTHPPPPNMLEPRNPLFREEDRDFYALAPSASTLPFMLSLPLDTGPPPFHSKHASIRFLLVATALIKDAGKLYRVRTSLPTSVLPTYDPEKALASLSSPLTATDDLTLHRYGHCESVTLTAGLHRQVWVSGGSIFIDVHIANKSHKPLRRVELVLERNVLCYKHAPAGTREKSASEARIFERNEQAIIARLCLKPQSASTTTSNTFLGLQSQHSTWPGVAPHDSETRTLELPIPREHATVRCGKFFEVRFFLNVGAHVGRGKEVSVQLPVTLVHLNSLDVVPNSVGQVARAVEERRAAKRREKAHSSPDAGHGGTESVRRQPPYLQGRAFAAPRLREVEKLRREREDLEALGREVEGSPRKFVLRTRQHGGLGLQAKGEEQDAHNSGEAVPYVGNDNARIRHDRERREKREREVLNPFADLAFTPPTTFAPRTPDKKVLSRRKEAQKKPSLPRMQSLDSMRSNPSLRALPTPPKAKAQPREGGMKPYHFAVVRTPPRPPPDNDIPAHVLGLSSSRHDHSLQRQDPLFETPGKVPPRPATGLSFRERMERSRFEFKGVRRKNSARSGRSAQSGKGIASLWESMRHRKKNSEQDGGWI